VAMRDALRWCKHWATGLASVARLPLLIERSEYLQRELSRAHAAARRVAWQHERRTGLETQTRASFDFQWEHMSTGRALPSDAAFMSQVDERLTQMLQLPREWFRGKRMVDIGCGIGRYSYGLLKLGASVTACDQSEAALKRTAELCSPYAERLALKRIDLLQWNDAADFDAAFCFGVVHHTGNTYLAMENVCRKVARGGRVFFMIYAVPETFPALEEVNTYERIAEETRHLSFDERKDLLERRFGPQGAHGWFDATSPRINDRLTFEEIADVLTELGFDEIRHTVVARNHEIVARRARAV
jgi:SAM-dependent methyltransferase